MEEKIIEKIQKLLTLGGSANKNESELAMKKAHDLMLKHNINMRSVENHDSEYIKEEGEKKRKVDPVTKYINSILQQFFFVRIVRSRRNGMTYFNYIGEKNNINTAMHTITYLKETFERLWKEYKKETGAKRGSKSSFIYGLHSGIVDKLEAQKQAAEQQYGLVLVDDQKATDKMNELFKNLSKSRAASVNVRDGKAQSAGYNASKNVNFSKGFVK